ncbi:dipeptidase, putative [Desulfitobacterium dichloroeliminans LMG P-21439]|uniref:Dipeptidase, putative n=1 Tax=Desulfitobacterium dichloroeliminans (strain LMG P-21439 / DCA1) TaxID=871963 RepID=L0F8Q7_DESDL|nr:dipeptidase PepV [Desulfitobacterium dichloroeliminans]AGA69343.1 dipeptidase, putative [Desulfitobacterium dichloroeliminans LMG P-21439]
MDIENLNQKIDGLKDEMIKAVQSCIQIKSVRDMDAALPGAPFGPGIGECLEWTLNLGKSLGFTVKNIDGYAGQIEMGTGELFGILGHLDVVPEGEGWSFPPYSGEIADGKIYGRGAVDDKGPTLAALFAMKAIKDAGIPLQKKVRLILGTDEESGWADMDYYKQKEEIPVLGFAPDAEFPLIHAEKGILHLEFTKRINFPHLKQIQGGDRANVVPDSCRVVLNGLTQDVVSQKLTHYSFPEGVSGRIENDGAATGENLVLIFKGVGAHGSLPQNGKNAVLHALQFLQSLALNEEENNLIQWLNTRVGGGFYGEGFNIAFVDEPSGKLSLNLGIIELSENNLRFVLDIRYPVTFTQEQILTPLQEQAEEMGLNIKVLSHQKAHHVPKDSPLVEALLKAYADVTGLEAYAFAIGGGTYAKVLPQGVAFGPLLPGEPEVIHCADEYIAIDSLVLACKVYAQAILNLARA